MELLQLRYFLAVAENEHMTNTAKQLHIAQPALTQSIHRLEQELGVSLFERAGRGIRLSPAGAYVRDRVKPAMETLENVARDVIVAKTSRCTPDSEAQRFYEFLLDYVAKRWEE